MNANELNPYAASENNIARRADVGSNNAPSTPNDQGGHSSEWAASTLEALVPITTKDHPANEPMADAERYEVVMQANALVPTPGSVSQLVPGAFPPSTNLGTVLLPNEQKGKDITTTAPDRDVQYVNAITTSALESMRDYATKTGEAVGSYLPESVAAYLPVSAGSSQAIHTNGSSSFPKENSSLAKTKEHAVSVSTSQPSIDDASSTNINPSTKKNPQHAASTDEPRTETMREGLESVKEENHVPENLASPSKDKPDNETTDRSTLIPTEASWDEHHAREGQAEAGADADASTRSLTGTQINQSLYTPGTSLFSGKLQDDEQSAGSSTAQETAQDEKSGAGEPVPESTDTNGGPGHDIPNPVSSKFIDSLHAAKESTGTADVKAPTAHNEDTEAKSQSHSQAQPVHRQTPITHGREYPLASHERAQITTSVKPASPQRPNSSESKPGSGSIGWERVDSSRATPGHGPPPVPRKDDEGAGVSARRSSAQATGVDAVATSATAGAGAAGDVGGMGAGKAAPVAPTEITKPVHAHAHGESPNGDGTHPNGTEGKKSGFFEKLKREVRALSGKHHKEDSAKKHVSKN